MTDALARLNDPDTAIQAAFNFGPQVTSIEQRILGELRGLVFGGMTSHDLADALGLELVTVSPRMKPLVEKNLVRDSGRRAESPSGRKRIIWEVV